MNCCRSNFDLLDSGFGCFEATPMSNEREISSTVVMDGLRFASQRWVIDELEILFLGNNYIAYFCRCICIEVKLLLYLFFTDVLLFRSFDSPKKQNSNQSGSSVFASSTVVSSDVAASSSSSAGDTASGIHLGPVNSTSDRSTSTKSTDSTDSSVSIDTQDTRKKSSSENLGMFVCRFFNFIFLMGLVKSFLMKTFLNAF